MSEFETICYIGNRLKILKMKMFRLLGPKELSPYLSSPHNEEEKDRVIILAC